MIRGLARLKDASQFRVLFLEDAAIGDAAVRLLELLQTFERLDVSGTRLTSAGIERLRQALPECRISG